MKIAGNYLINANKYDFGGYFNVESACKYLICGYYDVKNAGKYVMIAKNNIKIPDINVITATCRLITGIYRLFITSADTKTLL